MKNILVFPCGSEVALEIHRSLKFSTHFKLIGGSSVPDHGCFVFEDYIGDIPHLGHPDFLANIKRVVAEREIAGIYPAMDSVAATLKKHEIFLGCHVIAPPCITTETCQSKKNTYRALDGLVPIPSWTDSVDSVVDYPVFIKPDIGYGSRGTHLALNQEMARTFQQRTSHDLLFCEVLPGSEYTIDCFSNRHGELLFAGARKRARVSNGISVSTMEAREHHAVFMEYAAVINETLNMRGAWFFQMKEDKRGNPRLLEVAARLAGSSSLFRSKGVNFALLSLFDAFETEVTIEENSYKPVLDRALHNRYRLPIVYSTVYIDYDDCILLGERVNHEAISFIVQAINNGKKIILITRHAGDLHESLKAKRIHELFDEIIHIVDKTPKSMHMADRDAIFIDDSFSERAEVHKLGIPTFSPDMIEALL